MHPDLVSVLRCPVCRDALTLAGRTANCPQRHAFDLAKQGYLNLLPSASTGIEGDSAEMVEAREAFLAGGFYLPIREALATASAEALEKSSAEELVVEVGAGTGYYLEGVVGVRPGVRGLALDVSRYAARRAAKVDPERIGAVVSDAWRELPVLDGAARVVLNVFAPRNATEMARILAAGGVLLVVTPNQAHLTELIGVLGLVKVDEEKERRLTESLSGSFRRTGSESVEVTMRLDHAAVERLVAMTPSARHTAKAELAERIAVLADPAEVTLSVTLSTWRTI
ncbi:putative RNA methyltransferase [Kribbella sp. CA-293567]|uniref:putative RNA methyltransferase n=1 Tax=Kribbella sp. CA-293567 TaxID=3002436 RepID=UPI0022DD1F14|nr:methyltransferase type 11 [Kribbella sp. CA-293567]WBQ02342.1 methyltransferase type 11 [Kribbella sp. CA-293567]